MGIDWKKLGALAWDLVVGNQSGPTPPPTPAPTPTPGPTPVPDPPYRTFGVSIGEHRGRTLQAWLIPDAHPPIEGDIIAPWRVEFRVPRAITEGATLQVWPEGLADRVMWEGRVRIHGQTVDQIGRLPATDTELDPITLDWRRFQPLPAPRIAVGEWLYEEPTMRPWVSIGASFFAGFARYVGEGPDAIREPLDQLRSIGFNELRVFLSYNGGLGRFDPRAHLDLLPAFWRLCADYGFWVHQTVLADCPAWLPDAADQLRLFNQVCTQAVNAKWVRLEGVNEGDDPRNRAEGLAHVIASNLPVLASHGSAAQDGGYLTPAWGMADFHPRRDGSDWPRRVGHNAWEDVSSKLGIPVVASEIKRPDECGYKDYQFFEAGANAALFCNGATFHSTEGKAAQPLEERTRWCAEQFVLGVRAVPLHFRGGRYTAGHMHDSPVIWNPTWAGRAHAKILGNEACVVLAGMDPTQATQVRPSSGWGVREERGPFGQVLLLAR